MSSTGIEPKRQDVDVQALKEKDTLHSEVLVDKNLMSNAFEGENAEHKETVWQAAKTHKMACLWAFVSYLTLTPFTVCFLHSTVTQIYYGGADLTSHSASPSSHLSSYIDHAS